MKWYYWALIAIVLGVVIYFAVKKPFDQGSTQRPPLPELQTKPQAQSK